MKPQDIEKRSFEIITEELGARTFPVGIAEVVKRVIHTTADFDYADNLAFSPDVIEQAKAALCNGATIVTDTNMALSGISKPSLTKLGAKALCLMADPDIAREAKERGVTRAVVSMEHAARLDGPLIFAVGNAPTALIRLHELIGKDEVKPALVIGVPVGFVNVVEAKELFIGGKTPYIIARGRKGGSNVAAAIVNALLYRLIRREEESAAPALEKGLNTGTLERVREFFRSYSGPALTSEQIAEQVGLSRITVRRYVGHMAEHGELDSFVDYQTGGRPCIRYTAAGRS